MVQGVLWRPVLKVCDSDTLNINPSPLHGLGLGFINMVVILFTTELPDRITDALEAEGLEVHEALAISEVLALAEQHPFSSIIITPDVDERRADVIAQHYPTVRLHEQFPPATRISLN